MQLDRVLVTGGAGFIGSHLVDAYLRLGCRVTVIDDLSTGRRENLDPAAELIEGDAGDAAVLARLEGRGFDLVNHQAAQVDVRRSVADPAEDARINIVSSLALFEQCAREGVKKIVFASSGGAIYGEPVSYPQDESHPTEPMSPYGCAKLSVEKYLGYFRAVRGIATVAMRYANVYGPRQSSIGEAGVVAIFADRLLEGSEIVVNGSGEQTRDFVFVDDVVRANLAASQLPLTGSFNVGTGVETSVNQLVGLMRGMIESESEVRHAEAKMGEQMRSVLDGEKLRREANLPAPVAFEEGLRRTVEWFRART